MFPLVVVLMPKTSSFFSPMGQAEACSGHCLALVTSCSLIHAIGSTIVRSVSSINPTFARRNLGDAEARDGGKKA